MENIIIVAAVVIITGLAVFYIVKEKRNGRKCIGCPDSKACSGNCAACQYKYETDEE